MARMIVATLGSNGVSHRQGFDTPLRVARVLRPLRVASKFENIRVIVSALMDAMGGVSATIALGFFFYLIFGENHART